jgi:phenylalanyl-tRNA synthetase beta chain
MRVPIAWLREYVDLPENPQEIADRLALLGFPVEAIETRPVITGVVVGKIVALEKHPNADRLQVGKIDIGSGKQLTIATAATNVAVGQVIPVATIGAQLPELKIEPRKMRGIDSEGMMVSATELALPAEWFEDGIMQLDADTPLGTDVVKQFRLTDAVLEVEVTANRPDALSVLGIARELAAALGTAIRVPSFENPGTQPDAAGEAPMVTIESPDCVRFVAQRFTGVKVAPAPAWMRVRLALAGQRPISNLVDISNYVMLEVGQPLHFYDDAKIAHHHLIVRDARPGEKLVTLDDVEHELTAQTLVIADETAAQGLAGLKGGKFAEVEPETTTLLLESANFNGPRIRRMSLQVGFRTDASSRHEKTLAPALTDMGAARAAQLLAHIGATAFVPHAFGADVAAAPAIQFPVKDITRILGLTLPINEIIAHLEALGCTLAKHDIPAGTDTPETLLVTPPLWRRDVTIAADLIEEVARMAGYDRIPAEMPSIAAQAISSEEFHREQQLAQCVAALGYYEIISQSLQGTPFFEKLRRAGIVLTDPVERTAVEVRNPLSEDQRYLRRSLIPGLLDYFSHVAKPVRAFEIGHVFNYDAKGEIEERSMLAAGFSIEPVDEPEWSDRNFLRMKGEAFAVIREMTGRVPEIVRGVRDGFHPGKTASAFLDGREIATIGKVDPRFTKVFDVPFAAYLMLVYVDALPERITPHYVPPSKFPSTYRDLSLTLALDVTAASVEHTILTAIGKLCMNVHVFDEYRGAQVGPDRKSLAVRITLQRTDTTITDEEADAAIARALEALHTTLNATVRE